MFKLTSTDQGQFAKFFITTLHNIYYTNQAVKLILLY